MTQELHYSVLLDESVDALVVDAGGVYVDGTFGRGGHSRKILERLSPTGRLLAFDKDPEAVAVGREIEQVDSRFHMFHGSFAQLKEGLSRFSVEESIDGVLLDLGVSSPQLDTAERGFSFMKDGPLDMRMNYQSGISAAQWLAEAPEADIAFVIKEYGEERFAKRMAKAIVDYRSEQSITTTLQLAKIVSEAHPKWEKGKHPATKAFQGIRIFINSELDDLKTVLDDSIAALRLGGRLVVISFHSLEDRMVKRFFKEGSKGKYFPPEVPVTEEMLEKTLKLIGKAERANQEEVDENVRSRSAIMRVAERI